MATEDNLEEIRQQLEGLRSLHKFQPWVHLAKYTLGQAALREGQTNQPVGSVAEALVQNYQKGIVAGLRLAVGFPKNMMEMYQESFNKLLEEERNGSNAGTN